LGANNPTESGDYFAWGESEPKRSFSSYLYFDLGLPTFSGISPYDAATVIQGLFWRTPQREDWKDLYKMCEVTEFKENGIRCLKFTSKVNNKYIILPMTGFICGTEIKDSDGCYWSSSQRDKDSAYTNSDYFWKYKYHGLMIRPIYYGN
jgi:hypothetical protein